MKSIKEKAEEYAYTNWESDEYHDGEQKPADKVESHFHVEKGKWYMCIKNNVGITKGNAYYGISDGYIIDDNGRKYNCNNWAVFQRYLRLWNISDARDGDVLATSTGAFIYNGNNGGGSCPGCYCGIDTLGRFKTGVEHHWTGKKVNPATKEQREQLEKAIADAGYTFDFEDKKLKKIEPKTRENKGNIGGISANWSEEDKSKVQRICKYLNEAKKYYADITEVRECIDWLHSLQDRVQQQPKQEWSKKEDGVLFESISVLQNNGHWVLADKLKSLRPQNRWKPSDEQMECLSDAIKHYNSWGYPAPKLKELLDDLKKLKEGKV